MKKLSLLFTALLAFTACHSRSTSMGSESAQTIPAIAKSTSSSDSPNPQSGAVPLTVQQQCAVDLCGAAEKYLPVMANGPFRQSIPENVKTLLKEKIDPVLNQILDSSEKSSDLYRETLKTILDRNDLQKEDFNAEQLNVITFIHLFSKIQAHPGVLTSGAGGAVEVNEEKLTTAFPDWTPEYRQNFSKYLHLVFSNQYFSLGTNLRSMDYDLFLKMASQPAADISTAFIGMTNLLKTKLGSYALTSINMNLMIKSLSQPLSAIEKKQIMETFSMISDRYSFLDEAVIKASQDLGVDLKEIALQARTQLQSPSQGAADRQKTIDSCHDSIVQAMAAAPTEFRRRFAEQLIEKVKGASRASAKLYFRGHSLKRALETIDRVQFIKPLTLDGAKTLINDQLTTTRQNLDQINQLFQATREKNEEWASFLAVPLSRDSSDNKFQTLQDACNTMAPPAFEDKAYTSYDSIQLGWQSALFPEFGAGIIAHEIGHSLSTAIDRTSPDSQAYQQTRACTTLVHERLMKSGTGAAQASQFAEEDWADAFSATTMKELEKSWPYVQNMACGLVGLGADEKTKQFSPLDLSNLSTKDGHSESLLRALHTQRDLGRPVPASCLPLVKAAFAEETKACAL